jgi:transcription-repair coupling factor (superfamily II helicase)
MTVSGFVAGTLVHTEKGLVPIEQLKVGDMVLSKHESGEGEQAYKRVVRMFKSEEKKKIIYVSYLIANHDDSVKTGYLFCTKDHHFWVKSSNEEQKMSWLPAINLTMWKNHELETYNDKYAVMFNIENSDENKFLRASPNGEIAYLHYHCHKLDPEGVIDFRGNCPIIISGKGLNISTIDVTESLDAIKHTDKDLADNELIELNELLHKAINQGIDFEAPVYNIEVEDFHTYFISKAGILTHSSANIAP